MKFSTPYERFESAPENNSGKNHTETSGYITGKQQIDNLLNAGERLLADRRSLSVADQFDFPEGKAEEDINMPIDRIKNLDLVDVSEMQNRNESILKMTEAKIAEKQAAAKAADKAAEIAAIKAEAIAEMQAEQK